MVLHAFSFLSSLFFFLLQKTLPNIIAFSRLILFKRVVSRQNTADGNWYPLKYSKRVQIHLSRQVWTVRTTIYQNKEILRCFSTVNFMLNISGTHFSIHLSSILSCYNTCTHVLMHRTVVCSISGIPFYLLPTQTDDKQKTH